MEFLKWLESIRTPFLDIFFSLITKLGEETFLILIGTFILWCMNKKKGYYLLTVGFFGLLVNQFVKITARVPRPWVKDPSLTVVESARAEATGYSFPSGHTQMSVGLFGGLVRSLRRNWLRGICLVFAVLIPFSRMYLGVHTPADVLVSVAFACLLVFGVYPVIDKNFENRKVMNLLFSGLAGLATGYVLYVSVYPFPADTDLANLQNALENAYKILGAILGIWAGYWIDDRFVNYDTEAVWWAQIIKHIGGVTLFLGLRLGLKAALPALLGNHAFVGALRYFLMFGIMIGVWPMVFRFFPKK